MLAKVNNISKFFNFHFNAMFPQSTHYWSGVCVGGGGGAGGGGSSETKILRPEITTTKLLII